MRASRIKASVFAALLLFACAFAPAQTADQAWLRYGLIPGGCVAFPLKVRALGSGIIERSAVAELERSNDACWGSVLKSGGALSARANERFGGETVLGTVEEM